jgi:hypothetical protein
MVMLYCTARVLERWLSTWMEAGSTSQTLLISSCCCKNTGNFEGCQHLVYSMYMLYSTACVFHLFDLALVLYGKCYRVPSLQCVFLNACKTHLLGEKIVEALPHLTVICWESVAEDRACGCFARFFYSEIGKGKCIGEVPVEDAYEAARAKWEQQGFKSGDPEVYLVAGHRRPPVHGVLLLLANKAGDRQLRRGTTV